jgi:hypothetical protein
MTRTAVAVVLAVSIVVVAAIGFYFLSHSQTSHCMALYPMCGQPPPSLDWSTPKYMTPRPK